MKTQHSRFYLIITLLLLSVVLLGFGPRFFLRPFFEQPRHLQMEHLPIKFILHGVLMTLWYVLLVTQSALVNTKNIHFHKRMGWGLGIIAVLTVISAIPVMMGFAPRMVELGFLDANNPHSVWFQNLQWTNDVFAIITFTVMVSIGLLNRKNKVLHRTMMLFASMAFTGPATGRLMEWLSPSLFIEGTVTVYFLFPLTVLIHDWVKARKFPVYAFWGFLALALAMTLTFALPKTAFWTEVFLDHLK